LYEAPGREHGVFDYEVMRKILRLTELLEDEVPFVYEVTSLASAERMDGVEDGVEIRALRDDFPASQEELLALRERYVGEPL
ncbi:MAG: RND transporter, partial [Gammaproteobacteria bacterium]|nr:RND transporter [Gammaproteobacteria bacterium]